MRAPGAPADRVTRAQGRNCPYCGIRMTGKVNRPASPTRDHANPRAQGGGPVVMCCRRCNQDKGALNLREWAAVLQTRKGDYRWKTIAALAADLENGRVKFVPDIVDVVGLAPGVFA